MKENFKNINRRKGKQEKLHPKREEEKEVKSAVKKEEVAQYPGPINTLR
jgi:hypothetical protein